MVHPAWSVTWRCCSMLPVWSDRPVDIPLPAPCTATPSCGLPLPAAASCCGKRTAVATAVQAPGPLTWGLVEGRGREKRRKGSARILHMRPGGRRAHSTTDADMCHTLSGASQLRTGRTGKLSTQHARRPRPPKPPQSYPTTSTQGASSIAAIHIARRCRCHDVAPLSVMFMLPSPSVWAGR